MSDERKPPRNYEVMIRQVEDVMQSIPGSYSASDSTEIRIRILAFQCDAILCALRLGIAEMEKLR